MKKVTAWRRPKRISYFSKMTLYQFNALNETEQIETIWKDAVFQGRRTEERDDFYLYQIDDFYIEMKILKETDTILLSKTFKTTELLHPYLEQMNIKLP